MRALLLTAAAFALAACSGPIAPAPDMGTAAPAPATTPAPAAAPARGAAPDPEAAVQGDAIRLARAAPEAFALAEEVAAGCLLDGVLGGAAMVVDRGSERITIIGDEDMLAEITIVPSGAGTRVVLSGPAADDPALRRAILGQIDRAARTGDPTCPPLPA